MDRPPGPGVIASTKLANKKRRIKARGAKMRLSLLRLPLAGKYELTCSFYRIGYL
jgi:hypothetical protein